MKIFLISILQGRIETNSWFHSVKENTMFGNTASGDLVSVVGSGGCLGWYCGYWLWQSERCLPRATAYSWAGYALAQRLPVHGVNGGCNTANTLLAKPGAWSGLESTGRSGTFFLLLTLALTVFQALHPQGCLSLERKSFSCSPKGTI